MGKEGLGEVEVGSTGCGMCPTSSWDSLVRGCAVPLQPPSIHSLGVCVHRAGTADSEVGLAILLARQFASADHLLGRAATRDIRPSFRTL